MNNYESEGRGVESLPAHQISNDITSFIGFYRCLFFVCATSDYFLTTLYNTSRFSTPIFVQFYLYNVLTYN